MAAKGSTQFPAYPFLAGGGELGGLIRSFNWSATSLGGPEKWPSALRQSVNMLLNTSFPILICWGSDYIQIYNDAFRPINGENKHPQALGGSARDTYAEIWDTIGPMFEGVMSGTPVGFPDFLVKLYRNGYLEDCYFDFSYSPIHDDQGIVGGIRVICLETTSKVSAQQELAALNEELAAINGELAVTNEELRHTQKLLNQTVFGLRESEQRFRNLVRDATVGIILLIGPEMSIGIVNEAYSRIIRRTVAELDGRLLFDVIPDAEAYFRPIIDGVRTSGEPVFLYDTPYLVHKDGQPVTGYLNVVYQPYHESNGHISGVMVLCQDVTEQVISRFKLKEADQMTAMAIEAAKLGAWHIEPVTKTLVYNATLARIFGYNREAIMTYEEAIGQVTDEYRPMILAEINKAILEGGDYDITYQQRRFNDGELIWLRSFGKISQDKDGDHTIFSGFVMDITEQKKDEQRKNDFIGMVSHELKTPLTSLNAIIQLANQKLKNSEDPFLSTAMEKANNQVKRMTTMINGFLNISRLESGKILIEKQSFDMSRLIQEIIDESMLTLHSQKIVYYDCSEVDVYADRDKIGSVISNLVSNAVKYSPKEKQIIINCKADAEQVIVSVDDQGIGIRQEDVSKIFERYYRVSNNYTQHISGFGIGLYLSAEIIQLHNGRIWVESNSGKGSTFYFSLPLQ